MIQRTIAEIEARIQSADSVDSRSRTELLALVAALRSEIGELSRTHEEEAEHIAGAAKISTEEAIRQENDPEVVKSAVDDLSASVAGFETSHPRLVEAVNRICVTLSNIGI
jgi:hypothetical protein